MEIETDKAQMEVEYPDESVLAKILVPFPLILLNSFLNLLLSLFPSGFSTQPDPKKSLLIPLSPFWWTKEKIGRMSKFLSVWVSLPSSLLDFL